MITLTQKTENVPRMPAAAAKAKALRLLVVRRATHPIEAAIPTVLTEITTELARPTRATSVAASKRAEASGSLLATATIPTPTTMVSVEHHAPSDIRSRTPQTQPKWAKRPLKIIPKPPRGDMSDNGA